MDKQHPGTLIDLENRFWQSMVDQDTDAALELLNEPALMVSPMGSIKFTMTGIAAWRRSRAWCRK